MSNAFVTIKVCYVYNQWYDISCATLYNKNIYVKFIVVYVGLLRNNCSYVRLQRCELVIIHV